MSRSGFSRARLWPLALFALVGVTLALLFHGGGALYFGATDSDLTNQFYPWRVFLSRWLSRGVLPLWDPHVFGGYPVAEMQQMALFYPVSILSALLFSPRLSLIIMMAAHVVLAVVATYVALRRAIRLQPEGAFLGTAIYVFGGVFSIRIAAGHFTVVAVMAWIPFAVCAAARGAAEGGRFSRWMLGACVANAMVLLAGSPQYVIYLFWMQVAAVLAMAPRTAWIRGLLSLACAWMLAALIATPQWLPTLFYLPFTGRASGGSGMMGPTWKDLRHLAFEMLLPFPMGDDMRAPHLHMKNVWETGSYPGVIGLVLALSCGFDWWRRKGVKAGGRKVALSLVALGVYLAMGGWLPGFSGFREPLKARAILALGIAFCAAVQADRLVVYARLQKQRMVNRGLRRWDGLKTVMLLAAIALTGCLYALDWVKTHPVEYGKWVLQHGPPIDLAAIASWKAVFANPAAATPLFMASAAHVIAALLIALILLFLLSWHPRLSLGLLLLAAVLDPFIVHAYCYYSRNLYDAVELPHSLTAQMSPRLEPMLAGKELPWRVSLPPLIANRGHLLDGLNETAGYDPLMPYGANNRNALVGIVGTEPTPERDAKVSRALGRRCDLQRWEPQKGDLATSEILIFPEASLVSIERKVRIVEEDPEHYGPGVDGWNFLVSGKRGFLGMGRPPIDGKLAGLIDAMARGNASTTSSTQDIIIAAKPTNPNLYEFNPTLSSPGVFCLRMTWLPGWSVSVDGGQSQQALCANNWTVAVALPEGKHTVVFHYRPVLFVASLWMSALGCVAALLMFIRSNYVPGRIRR